MPVPIVAPMPNSESWNSPIERASSPSGVGPRLLRHLGDGLAPQKLLLQCRHALPSLQSTSRASRSAQVSRRTTSLAVAAGREHHRDPAVAVVVVRHRVAVRTGRRDRDQVADARRVQPTPSTSTSPLSQCRPTSGHRARRPSASSRPAIAASKRWPYSATSRLSPMPPSTATNVPCAALDGDDSVERRRRGRHHAAAGLDDQLRVGRQMLARRADQRVEVGRRRTAARRRSCSARRARRRGRRPGTRPARRPARPIARTARRRGSASRRARAARCMRSRGLRSIRAISSAAAAGASPNLEPA